jgi:hypothetical protein
MPRTLASFVIPPLLAIAALAAASPAAAQRDDRVLERAGAGGRFEMLIDRSETLPGHASSKVRGFREQLDSVVALMRALPAVSEPPSPGCTRLDSWIVRNDVEPVLMGSVGVQIPEVLAGGGCAKRSEMSVQVGINHMEGFLPVAHATSAKSKAHDWYVLETRRAAPGMIELESGSILYFRKDGSPFRAVTSEAYARHQLDQLTSGGAHDGGELGALYRARIASWSPEQRASPACIPDPAVVPSDLAAMVIDVVSSCPAGRRVVEIDGDFLEKSRPAAIQLISLVNPPRASVETDGSWQLRSIIWSQIDHSNLRALISER